ncbi:hypothetical protein GCM10009098_08370 [Rheinheimera aquimaris]|uniref:Uncharacterized protein n=1 Tax=Rheinheimera aquimaris TaxID=412437 RepID=A0ABN1DHL0_9GAMM|nr:hypothetical protein [Rheinheimera aquimaris]MCB5211991.1 hypothetical protein [Rheinheimera aquimaris]
MPKPRKSIKQTNPALMRGIYLAIIIGIVAIFAIVTLESIISILSDAFADS